MPKHQPLSIYSFSSSDGSTEPPYLSAGLRYCHLEESTDSSLSSNRPIGFASQQRAPCYRLSDPYQTRDDMAIQSLKWHPPFNLTGPNGFELEGCPSWYEDIQGYCPGGHHPVHLGDTLGNRYKVIHKLGHGGFANVWLCRDLMARSPKYIALKILKACFDDPVELSMTRILKEKRDLGLLHDHGAKFICLPLKHFELESAAGFHHSFVYPVAGPQVSQIVQSFGDQDKMLRRICLQAAQTMRTLHDAGICHGDFRPSNILLQTTGLDGLSEAEVLKAFGYNKPSTNPVISTHVSSKRFARCVPRYLIKPVDSSRMKKESLKDEIYVMDFGVSFTIPSPPKHLGLPCSYRAPEAILEGNIGIPSDLWALGCTLFEIRTGSKLINVSSKDIDQYLVRTAKLLGPFPERWWTTTWRTRREFFKDELDSQGRVIEAEPWWLAFNLKTYTKTGELVPYQETRSIREELESGACVDFMEALDITDSLDLDHAPFTPRDIPPDEIEALTNLLEATLQYEPGKRPGLREIVQHDWFNM